MEAFAFGLFLFHNFCSGRAYFASVVYIFEDRVISKLALLT